MLRDVRSTVSDGLLGFATATGDGRHIKIGVSPVESASPIVITNDMDAAIIKSRLGFSPLADATMDSVQYGASRIYCFPVKATTAGSVGEVKKESGGGGGTLTVEGAPTNAFGVIVKITAQGGLNTAAFAVSIDGGYTYTDELTVPVSGTYTLEGTGLTLKFAEAAAEEQKPSSFLVGDSFTFRTTAPTMTNGDVLTALERVKNFSEEFEFIHVVGESTLPLWQALDEVQKELFATYHKPAFFLLEATYPSVDGDLTDWALQMETDRKKVRNYDIQVCTAWGRLVRMDGSTQIVNLAGLVSGLYARAPVQESIGKTRTEAGYGISKARLLELLPAGYDSSIIEILDVAGYLTFREYDGLDDFYVYHAKMMSPDGSDFRYAEDVRVLNKIVRETRKEGLQFKNDDIDLEDIQGELEARAKFLFVPLQRMIDAQEISGAEITVTEGQTDTFLETETMKVKVRYLSRGYIREVDIDIGRSAPSN